MNLLYLSADDFNVQRGTNGNILCQSIRGVSLVMFYSTKCAHCKTLLPIFRALPRALPGVHFGIINVMNERDIIRKASQTITPIEYVPLIILYYNGRPYMLYKGEYNIEYLKRFIVEVVNNIRQKQKFSTGKVVATKNKIPGYSIGIPVSDESVCYLEMGNAYNS